MLKNVFKFQKKIQKKKIQPTAPLMSFVLYQKPKPLPPIYKNLFPVHLAGKPVDKAKIPNTKFQGTIDMHLRFGQGNNG